MSTDQERRNLWTEHRPDNFIYETGLVVPRKGAIKKLIRRSLMTTSGRTADIARSPDRVVLQDEVFPEVAARGGNILFVGTQAYTIDYPALLEASGGTCWTIDCDPAVARFGSPNRHIIGSILDLDQLLSEVRFETIILAGVFGFGVNRLSEQVAILANCFTALTPDGFLVLSWNERRVPSSVLEEATTRWFDFRSSTTTNLGEWL